MFLELKDFLTLEEVERLRAIAAKVDFVDGKVSNPYNNTKNNQQASEADPSGVLGLHGVAPTVTAAVHNL